MRLMTYCTGEKTSTQISADPVRILKTSWKTLTERRNGRLDRIKHETFSRATSNMKQIYIYARICQVDHQSVVILFPQQICRSYKMRTASEVPPVKDNYASLVFPLGR